MASVRRATTVLLLRDGVEELEVFMVQRHRRSGFLPLAWVFPGGRVDPGDEVVDHPRVAGGVSLAEGFGLPVPVAVAHGLAGVRETFEEAGVWLGTGALASSLREPMAQGEVSLLQAMADHDAHVDLEQLRPWSCWVTPEAEPKRYDTLFLAMRAPDAAARHDEREVVDSRWVSPRAVIAARDQEGFPLAPPTWWTLRELAAFASAEAALAAVRPADRPVQPVMRFGDAGVELFMPGHPEHGAPEVPGFPHRVTYDGSWVAWHAGQRMSDL
ncbi:MAG: NUDIX hydrolase [Myxococcales bacterium]|nr:NUDIX hydrolase [Myxococcales bacterium]